MGSLTRRDWARLIWVVALTLGLMASAVQAQEPTFTVRGEGTALTRLSLKLEVGQGLDRPAMLQMARATQRALHSSGFFSVSILPPGQSLSGAGSWGEGQVPYPIRLSVGRQPDESRRVLVEVQEAGIGRTSLQRQFEIRGGTNTDIGYAVADILYAYFLERPGYFTERLLFVQTALDQGRKVHQIASSDLFGEDLRVHVSSRSELTSPKMTPDRRGVVYVAIRNERPQLFRKNFAENREQPVFNDREIRFAPAFDNAGNLYYTKVVEGNSDIYRVALGSRREQRLTTDPDIETAPAVSPDGSRLAYVSDAGARLRVIVRPVNGGASQTLGTAGGSYGSPSWSPDGSTMAVTRQSGGTFSITVIDLDTGQEKNLSTSFFEQHPIWAENGKVLVFERAGRGGGVESGLWQVDLDTTHLFRLPIEGRPRDPAWTRPAGGD